MVTQYFALTVTVGDLLTEEFVLTKNLCFCFNNWYVVIVHIYDSSKWCFVLRTISYESNNCTTAHRMLRCARHYGIAQAHGLFRY